MRLTLAHLTTLTAPHNRPYLCAAQYVILIDALTYYVQHYTTHTPPNELQHQHELLNTAQLALDIVFHTYDYRRQIQTRT